MYLPCGPTSPSLVVYPRENKLEQTNISTQRCIHLNVLSSFMSNDPKLESVQVSVNKWMGKESGVYDPTMGWALDSCSSMTGCRDNSSEQKSSDKKRMCSVWFTCIKF